MSKDEESIFYDDDWLYEDYEGNFENPDEEDDEEGEGLSGGARR
jgi:hypothetical protein